MEGAPTPSRRRQAAVEQYRRLAEEALATEATERRQATAQEKEAQRHPTDSPERAAATQSARDHGASANTYAHQAGNYSSQADEIATISDEEFARRADER
jgi:hypothetical protein